MNPIDGDPPGHGGGPRVRRSNGARIPTSTYRVQLNRDLTLQQAADLLPYLERLGVSDLYVSPILQSRRGSTHGYDVTDPGRIDEERGGEAGIEALEHALSENDMGLLVDIVPNHMAASVENPWWADVLRHGPASRYARHFDIEWAPPDPELQGRVLLPVVDGSPDDWIHDRRVRIDAQEGLAIDVGGLKLPLDPASLRPLLEETHGRLRSDHGPDVAARLDPVLEAVDAVPEPVGPAVTEARVRRTAAFDEALADAMADPAVRSTLAAVTEHLEPHAVAALVDAQRYLLVDWRTAPQRVNYRRFFDINDLVSVRMEDPGVFHDMHARLIALAKSDVITGLRVDHIDGLADPRGYLERLQEVFGAAGGGGPMPSAAGHPGPPFYVVAEKILVGPEGLPEDWPVHGATGYEANAHIEGLFADTAGLSRLEEVYGAFIGERRDYDEVVHEAKLQVVRELFPGLFGDLAHRLHRIRGGPDHEDTRRLQEALETTAAAFPVYRTYCTPGRCTTRDHQIAHDAVQAALRRRPDLQDELESVQAALSHRMKTLDPDALWDWHGRWQQTTGPVMAKGYEDTALYRYFSLVSLNEVGDRPDRPIWLEDFHAAMTERLGRTPHGLTAGTTHDSKRSEDVRARLNVLSERPDDWATHIETWRRLNADKKPLVDGLPRPGPDMEYLLYETLVGAWPLDVRDHEAFPARVAAYMLKAAREAKRATHWLHPDEAYESALTTFATRLAGAPPEDPFRRSLETFVDEIAPVGMVNGLAQTLLRSTIPGVPDTYQGQELWDFSLVDPDNRRPVDFARRAESLQDLDAKAGGQGPGGPDLAAELVASWRDGRIKTYVLSRALRMRRRRPALFGRGEYIPLQTQGRWGRHVVAFARHLDRRWALVVAPRSTYGVSGAALPVGDVWEDTAVRLPAGTPATWYDTFTGAALAVGGEDPHALPVREIFATLPVALLTEEPHEARRT